MHTSIYCVYLLLLLFLIIYYLLKIYFSIPIDYQKYVFFYIFLVFCFSLFKNFYILLIIVIFFRYFVNTKEKTKQNVLNLKTNGNIY